MAEQTAFLPEKLAERKLQIEARLARSARARLEATRAIERLDDETTGLEARYAEIEQCERIWQSHLAILKAQKDNDEQKANPEPGTNS